MLAIATPAISVELQSRKHDLSVPDPVCICT